MHVAGPPGAGAPRLPSDRCPAPIAREVLSSGLLSVRRGGGSFEFLLTPAANAKLDKEWLVIGQIMEPEGMQLLARLNSLPTNNYDQTPIVLVKVERAVPLPSGGKA